ncbi:MAG: GH3 family domain-containing protein [Bacteriovoracaceae bacterium]
MKRLFTPIFHHVIKTFYARGHMAFRENFDRLEIIQRQKLSTLLAGCEKTEWGKNLGVKANLSYEHFKEMVPLQSYETLEPAILEQRKSGLAILSHQCQRYQPTSGSSNQRKWIPYNQALLDEFDKGAGPWIYDLYTSFPHVIEGKHYWSLSWLPQNLKAEMVDNDDLNYFPWYKRLILKFTMAVPSNVQNTPTLESSRYLTLIHLANTQNLSMIFIWSPTYFFSLLEELMLYRESLSESLKQGKFTSFVQELEKFRCPSNLEAAKILLENDQVETLVEELWPMLSMLSCWDTAEAHFWTEKIKKQFPRLKIQGKGLVATEAMVTIPFQDQYLLSYHSHFFEFMDLHTKEVLPSWELKKGQHVKPILTTGNGFCRYMLEDHLLVLESFYGCPNLKFMGRLGGVDLVGEKISRELSAELLNLISLKFAKVIPVTLVGVRKIEGLEKSGYVLIVEVENDKVDYELLSNEIAKFAESWLMESHHYHLARDLKQLLALQVYMAHDGLHYYQDLMLKKGLMEGDIKVESLIRLDEWGAQ